MASNEAKDLSLIGLFKRMFEVLFKVKIHQSTEDFKDRFHLEPKYWPEVQHFIQDLNETIHVNTIDDSNIAQINQRIVRYIEEQINNKGQIEDIEERYQALHTLADRFTLNFNRIVGLKHSKEPRAGFSELIHNFKNDLEKRHQEELHYYRTKVLR